mmetsp:Transcript_30700/g.70771  ORF Transcript_30700/g.70771 Transcript_30700/m.70771 type:complete len:226 (-) Transcript_30700:469-1146(-)
MMPSGSPQFTAEWSTRATQGAAEVWRVHDTPMSAEDHTSCSQDVLVPAGLPPPSITSFVLVATMAPCRGLHGAWAVFVDQASPSVVAKTSLAKPPTVFPPASTSESPITAVAGKDLPLQGADEVCADQVTPLLTERYTMFRLSLVESSPPSTISEPPRAWAAIPFRPAGQGAAAVIISATVQVKLPIMFVHIARPHCLVAHSSISWQTAALLDFEVPVGQSPPTK